ncbi:MAG: tetratricopeptide repeat protein [Bacteroidota bacterium]
MKKILSLSCCLFIITSFFSQEKEKLKEKANLAFDKEEFKDCIKYADKALNLDPGDFELYELKARSLMETEQYQEAFGVFNVMVEKFPNDPLSYHQRGNFFLAVNEVSDCISDFRKSNELTDDDSLKRMNLGNIASIYSINRRFTEAYDIFIEILKQDPQDLVALTNIAVVCGDLGQFDKAIEYLNQALVFRPDFSPLYLNLGFTYQQMEQHDKAIENFNKSLEMTPDDAYAYNNRGYSKLKLGQLKEAMQDVEKSIKLNEHNAYAYRNKALIYIEKKELDKACENIKIAIDKNFVTYFGYEIIELRDQYCK